MRASLPSMIECIEHPGAPGPYGHVRVWHEGSRWYAHRLAWVLANGSIRDGLLVLHRCGNGRCVNLAHLYLGTQKDNMADMRRHGREGGGKVNAAKTHCPHGHPYSGNNLVIRKAARGCRECDRIRLRRRRAGSR